VCTSTLAAPRPSTTLFWPSDTVLMPTMVPTGSSRTPGELAGVMPDTSRWLAVETSAVLPARPATQLFKSFRLTGRCSNNIVLTIMCCSLFVMLEKYIWLCNRFWLHDSQSFLLVKEIWVSSEKYTAMISMIIDHDDITTPKQVFARK